MCYLFLNIYICLKIRQMITLYIKSKITKENTELGKFDFKSQFKDFLSSLDNFVLYSVKVGNKQFELLKYKTRRSRYRFVLIGKNIYNLSTTTLFFLMKYYNNRKPHTK